MILITTTFANPWAWSLMIIPILMMLYYAFFGNASVSDISTSNIPNNSSQTLSTWFRKLAPIMTIIASILLVVAIARPQDEESKEKSYIKGIDIMLAIDVSTSMLEKDFSPNRLEAAKEVASEFVEKRKNDRIGLTVFSGESYIQCPPTIDHGVVQKQLKTIHNGIIEDGTAIGMGLATSVRALKNSDAKSRVCILLTDGVNTTGIIDPLSAVDIAKAFDVKVYCIGVGKPKEGILGIDEPMMKTIAKRTGGLYFRAGSNDKLKQIYDKINSLETYEIEVNNYNKKSDKYLPWAIGALVFYLLSIVFRYIIGRGL